MYVCVCRVGQNVPEKSPVADTVLVENQQPALQHDPNYFTVDDMQQQMLAISANPAYKFVPEHSQHPLQGDDHTYSNIGTSQQKEVVTGGKPAAPRAKNDTLFSYSIVSRSATSPAWGRV